LIVTRIRKSPLIGAARDEHNCDTPPGSQVLTFLPHACGRFSWIGHFARVHGVRHPRSRFNLLIRFCPFPV